MARLLVARRKVRDLTEAATEVAKAGRTIPVADPETVEGLGTELEQRARDAGLRASLRRAGERPVLLHEILAKAEEDRKAGRSQPVKVGYPDVDDLADGFGCGWLVVIGGRSGVGKSTLALNFMVSMYQLTETPSAFISLEMPTSLCARRYVDIGGDGRDQVEFRQPRTSDMAQVLFEARAAVEVGAKVVFLDNIQICKHKDHAGEGGVQVIAGVTRDLKLFAMEMDVPVVAISHLNRDCDREGRRPTLRDLKGSGSIEQDADLVLLLHREGMDSAPSSEIDIICAKNRHGRGGHHTTLEFDGTRYKRRVFGANWDAFLSQKDRSAP
jgi:replicative DNA helicase